MNYVIRVYFSINLDVVPTNMWAIDEIDQVANFNVIISVCSIRVFHCSYIAIVWGLNVGSAHCDQLSLQLFINYITSTVGGAACQPLQQQYRPTDSGR